MTRKAFTLIELLVVIAIIAILAAILFPVFAQAKLAAKKTAGLSQAKQIGLSMHMYLADYDDTFFKYRFNGPTGSSCSGAACINTDYQKYRASNPGTADTVFGAQARDVMFAKQVLDPYSKNNDIWKAPSQINAWSGYDPTGIGTDPAFRSYGGQNGYALNGYLFTPLSTAGAVMATTIEDPSNTIVMIDGSYYVGFPKNPCTVNGWTPSATYQQYWRNLGNSYTFRYPTPPTDAEAMILIDQRYSGMLNTVRADSSAKSVASSKALNEGPSLTFKQSMWDPYKLGCQ